MVMKTVAQRALRIGCAGAGRAGKVHIKHLQRTKDAEIVAICTPDPTEQAWARQIAPQAMIYSDYESFINHNNGKAGLRKMEALWLSTPTPLHRVQVMEALRRDLHIFCEKPLSKSPSEAHELVKEATNRPHLKVGCAFPRRFDSRYIAARKKIAAGAIGKVLLARSQTTDMLDRSDFWLQYAKNSGGIFVDSAVHCIDICLFLIGAQPGILQNSLIPVKAYATGSTQVFPKLQEWGDADNVLGLVNFAGGVIANFRCSRTNRHGHHSMTEIIGTEGNIIVNQDPRVMSIDVSDRYGTRMEAAVDHFDLFERSFEEEKRAFLDWVLYDKEPNFNLHDAAMAVKIGDALQKSLREGRHVDLD